MSTTEEEGFGIIDLLGDYVGAAIWTEDKTLDRKTLKAEGREMVRELRARHGLHDDPDISAATDEEDILVAPVDRRRRPVAQPARSDSPLIG